MNGANFDLIEKYVPHSYVQQGREARRVLEKNIRILLEQGKLPVDGWDDLSIKHLLNEVALMDSNNFPENCGVGEREARIASSLVAERHFHLGHGMGRSGDIAEVQPKAAGSSLIAKLANSFALDVLKLTGVTNVKSCLVVPVATGMALVLTMLALKEKRPNAKYVIWPRIDQKSCFKSILTAGLQPIIVENVLTGDHLTTDVSSIRRIIGRVGHEKILCVMSTTSCFAPRIPDRLEDIANVCKEYAVPHIVNNAYGVQATKCMHLIQQASRCGRLDTIIQSTDKNFMVPVGGAIIAGFDKSFVQSIGKMYPGRASASPVIDFFITMLSLGSNGYKKLLSERKELYLYLQSGLNNVAGRYGERVLDAKQNQISLGVSLTTLDKMYLGNKKRITEFGSHLFKRSVSGTRVVTPFDEKNIGGYTFTGWGAHFNKYPCSYLTAAAAIGTTKQDIDLFLKRLDKTFKQFLKDYLTPEILLSSTVTTKNHYDGEQSQVADMSYEMTMEQRVPLSPTLSLNGEYDDRRNTTSTALARSHSDKESYVSGTWPKALRRDSPQKGFRSSANRKFVFDAQGRCSSDGTGEFADQELASQIVLPEEKSKDKMSFLVDI